MKITTAELAHTTKYITSGKEQTNYAPPPNRTTLVSGIANIIADPTQFGISWAAATSQIRC